MADKGGTMKHYDELPDGTEPTVRKLPLGCDQQGRYPQAAEPVTDLDELGVRYPEQEPLWLKIAAGVALGAFVVSLVVLAGLALWRMV